MVKDNILKVFTVFAIFVMLVAFLPSINNSTALVSVEDAKAFLARNGWIAYADVSGNFEISGDLDVSGTITGDGSGLTGVDADTVDGYNAPRTATYVVAASDAPVHVKAQADYTCDGTDDDGAGAPSVGNNLFDAIPDTVDYYRSLSNALGGGAEGVQVDPILWQATGNDWVNFIITDAAGADTVGTIYLKVIGK